MTQNLQAEIDKLTQQHEQKIAELKREHEVRALLGEQIDGYEPPSIHFYPLYGARGSITFKGCPYESIRKGKAPDADLLRYLLATFPPLPCVKVNDGCTSFRPDLGESYSREDRAVDEYDCFGVIVRVETHQEHTAKIEWYTSLGGEIWKIAVSVPWYATDFGQLDMAAKRWPDGKVIRWERCELRPKHDAQRIRWASGSSEYPNEFTLYWDRDTGASLDFPALAFAR